jgi:hypothetical protein
MCVLSVESGTGGAGAACSNGASGEGEPTGDADSEQIGAGSDTKGTAGTGAAREAAKSCEYNFDIYRVGARSSLCRQNLY